MQWLNACVLHRVRLALNEEDGLNLKKDPEHSIIYQVRIVQCVRRACVVCMKK